MSINTLNIAGNVTKDFELRKTQNGTPVATFTVAVNDVYYDRDGKRCKRVDFIPVTCYGKAAENNAKYLKKGSPVAVTCTVRSWYKQDENKGGFNFELKEIAYMDRAAARDDSANGQHEGQPSAPAHDDWMDDYNRAEQAGYGQHRG